MNDTSTPPPAGADAPRGDTGAAISFLRRWPAEMMHLFASPTDRRTGKKGKVEGASFAKTEAGYAAAWKWIEERQDGANLYFHCNDLIGNPKNKHARKDEVAVYVGPHTDVDPRKIDIGDPVAHLAAERERIQGRLDNYNPRPPVVIFSGNGLQAYWPLPPEDRIEIKGDIAKAVDVERYNIQIEHDLGGDNCHDVSRLMRLPGTWNIPDERKLKRGCVPVLATLVRFEDTVFPLSAFKQAPLAQTPPPGAGGGAAVQINTTNVIRFKTLDALPKAVNAKMREVIRTGDCKKDPYASRSEALCAVIASMHRAGCDDQLIFNTITDPVWRISLSVLDKPNPAGYAIRQIQQVKEDVAAQEAVDTAKHGPVVPAGDHMARALMFRDAADAKRKHIVNWQSDFQDYDAGRYVIVEVDTLQSEIAKWLKNTRTVRDGRVVPFEPGEKSISETTTALRNETHLDRKKYAQPCWLDNRSSPKPAHLISFPNGLLNIFTDEFLPPSPDLFTSFAAGFDYDPAAPEPTKWLAFLDEVFRPREDAEGNQGEVDKDQIDLLQEMFGYCLVPAETKQHKAFMFLGETRSGKGTMMQVLQGLLPPDAVAGPSFQDLGTNFGLSQLVGKQVAVIDDVQIDENTRDKDRMVQNIKRITGGSTLGFDRKHRAHFQGKLPVKLVVMANEMLQLRDRSGALAGRFCYFQTRNSFFDREDPDLFERDLEPELAGILKWALAGLRRQRKNKRFGWSKAHAELSAAFADHGVPMKQFVRERCLVEPKARIEKDSLFAAYLAFCCDNEVLVPGNMTALTKGLVKLYPGRIGTARPSTGPIGMDGQKEQVPHYTGICLHADHAPSPSGHRKPTEADRGLPF